jgi:hypothetical protein
MLHFIKCVFFLKKTTFLPNKILNILSKTKKKKWLYPLLYISNYLNQSKTFRKFKNENINKNKYFRLFEVTYSQKTNRKLKKIQKIVIY